ncbi:MAG TPA: zinc ribbon domain-containing protein YjdM [Patescibacteria group bacterium]|nr:zinc ribbon domain-containing protein YjdM [Patescibacteria group bacterium]
MTTTPACPQCGLDNTYPDGELLICADCGHEWHPAAATSVEADSARIVRDANGSVLADGDSVVLIKDLKVKGSSSPLKMGTKIRNIRIVDGDHEIDCKTDLGAMLLKAEFLKKV